MEINIRKYLDSDFVSVRRLINEAFDLMISRPLMDSNHLGLVACIENKVVGYLLLTKIEDPLISRCYFFIDYVCVDSKYRNNNIGYLLMSEAEKIAIEHNAKYLQLTSSRVRVVAHKLYKKCGFDVRESDIFRKVL